MVKIFQPIKIRKILPYHSGLKFVINFIINWVVFMLVAVPIHEYSHFITLVALGGDGYIKWNVTLPTQLPAGEAALLIVALMGGIGVMIVYFLLMIVSDDTEERCALSAIAIEEGIYGVGEMLLRGGMAVSLTTFSVVGYLIGIVPTVVLLWRKFARVY